MHLQSRTPQQAYVRWWTPNNEKEITALRHVDFRDFSLQNQRKRFSDWKIVCEGLDTLLSWADVPLPDEKSVTVETVQKNFIKAFEMHNAQVKFLHPSKKKACTYAFPAPKCMQVESEHDGKGYARCPPWGKTNPDSIGSFETSILYKKYFAK